jgi:hypothetical protein
MTRNPGVFVIIFHGRSKESTKDDIIIIISYATLEFEAKT